jgi:hypothetical protein
MTAVPAPTHSHAPAAVAHASVRIFTPLDRSAAKISSPAPFTMVNTAAFHMREEPTTCVDFSHCLSPDIDDARIHNEVFGWADDHGSLARDAKFRGDGHPRALRRA